MVKILINKTVNYNNNTYSLEKPNKYISIIKKIINTDIRYEYKSLHLFS